MLTLSLPSPQGEVATRLVQETLPAAFPDTGASKSPRKERVLKMIGLLSPALLRWVSPPTNSLYHAAHKNTDCALAHDFWRSKLLLATATSWGNELTISSATAASAWGFLVRRPLSAEATGYPAADRQTSKEAAPAPLRRCSPFLRANNTAFP